MEGLVREREAKHNQTTEERIRMIGQRLDGLNSKLEDPQNGDFILVDSLESRLSLLERAIERATNTCLALNDCVMSQQSFRQSLGEQTTSMTPSEATTIIASALDDQKWTCSPLHTSSNSSEDEQTECDESEHGDTITHHKDPFPKMLPGKLVRRASTSHLLSKKVIVFY
jgi:hypothetical protein